jgi:hypothetical protein
MVSKILAHLALANSEWFSKFVLTRIMWYVCPTAGKKNIKSEKPRICNGTKASDYSDIDNTRTTF